jgi:hypothetical protein
MAPKASASTAVPRMQWALSLHGAALSGWNTECEPSSTPSPIEASAGSAPLDDEQPAAARAMTTPNAYRTRSLYLIGSGMAHPVPLAQKSLDVDSSPQGTVVLVAATAAA